MSFRLISPWTAASRMTERTVSAGSQASEMLGTTLLCIIIAGAALLARQNTTLKRSDMRGAARLGAFVFAISVLQHLFSMYHLPKSDELSLIGAAVSKGLMQGAFTWMLYLAVEPFVRRHWPQTIVSWSRALSGKLRDPLVGGDILIGVAFSLFWTLLFQVLFLVAEKQGDLPNASGLGEEYAVRYLVSGFLLQVASGIMFAFGIFFLMFLLRLVLRNNWLAALGFVAIFCALRGLSQDIWALPFFFVVYLVLAFLLLRFGIVPLIVGVVVADCLLNAPLTLNFSSWYISESLFVLAATFAIAFYGFRCAVAGKSLFEVE